MQAENCMLVFALLLALTALGFGIASTAIAGENSDAKDECGPAVWYALLFVGITHLMSFLNFAISVCLQTSKSKLTDALIVATSIWCCVAYFGVSDDCADFYDDKFPDLREMLLANVVLFFVGIGISVFFICAGVFVQVASESKPAASGVVTAV